MSRILNLQLTTEQTVTFQVLHSERRLREFEMILDTAQTSFRPQKALYVRLCGTGKLNLQCNISDVFFVSVYVCLSDVSVMPCYLVHPL